MRAVVLGINGLTGRAIASELADAGWLVTGTGQDASRFPRSLVERGVGFCRSDRNDPGDVRRVLSGGADVVVDCLCYTASHACSLLDCAGSFSAAVVLSSKAVYVDDAGLHSNSPDAPRFDGPVTEEQPVLAPDFSGAYTSREGYGANKVAAERVLLDSGVPVSILRPSLIHGPGAARPREWFVLKRLLDGRARIPLAHHGRTGNHPTASVNLARLTRVCAERPGQRILNAADPGAPTAAEVVQAIAAASGHAVEVVGLEDDAPVAYGWSPWASWPPFFLDTTAATRFGYQRAGAYAQTVTMTVDDLRSAPPEQRAQWDHDPYFTGRFDYHLDDAALAPR